MLLFNRGVTTPLLLGTGTAAAPAFSFSGDPDTGIYNAANTLLFSCGGTARAYIGTTSFVLDSSVALAWNTSSADLFLARDAANVLALKNGTTAQEFRIYGTTTGPQYLSLSHNATLAQILTNAGGGALRFGVGGTAQWEINSTIAGRLVSLSNQAFAHGVSALATTATEGFFHLQSCAGAPTGVPASIPTGQVPMIFDTTNSRLYIYHGAAWHYIAQTA